MWLTRIMVVAAMFAVLLVALACGGDDGGSEDVGDDGVREIQVRMTDELQFEPAEISLEAGQPVRLVIDNGEAASIHDFTVQAIPVTDVSQEGESSDTGGHMGMGSAEEFDLHLALESGMDGVLEFTPTEAGEYEYLCTVTGHAEAGMTGTMTVG
ncbi:MAG: plastocyanin/azurin family copper-binding protein [Dehalococcoidia bacterium]